MNFRCLKGVSMFSSIIRFSLQHKLLVLAGALVIVVWGLYSFSRLPIDAIPDITNNQVQVLTVCPTLATQEVEQFVTSPIELEVRNIPGVVLPATSVRKEGATTFILVLDEALSTSEAVAFRKVEVEVLREDNQRVIIQPGVIQKDDLVVLEGAYYVQAQSQVAEFGEEE